MTCGAAADPGRLGEKLDSGRAREGARPSTRTVRLAFAVVALLCLVSPVAAQDSSKPRELSRRERKDRVAQLDQKYRDFLTLVEPIMTGAELNLFLLMESDAQRDRFIDDFWQRRDPDPKTTSNEFREDYQLRYEEAKKLFRSVNSDRGKVYLLSGEPTQRLELNRSQCKYTVPLEVWRYSRHPRLGTNIVLIFIDNGANNHRLWRPMGNLREALRELISLDASQAVAFANSLCQGPPPDTFQAVFYGWIDCKGVRRRPLIHECGDAGDTVLAAVRDAESDKMGSRIQQVFDPPEARTEDLGGILRTSVIANPNAPKLQGEISSRVTGSRGERVSFEVSVQLPTSQLKGAAAAGHTNYKIDVNGETLKNDAVFETFHYRFDLPTAAETVPVTVERHLYPAAYKVRLKLTDQTSGAEGIFETAIELPKIDRERPTARAAAAPSGARLRLLPLDADSVAVGFTRVEAISSDPAIASVEFFLDGTRVMSKRGAPYTISLDLGPVPRARTVRAVGRNAGGEVVDADELLVNAGADPFRVKIVSPRTGSKAARSVRVEIEPSIPQGRKLRHIEIFVDDQKVATLYAEPFVQTVPIGDASSIVTIRAMATLEDQTIEPVEDLAFINAPDYIEQIQVHLIELPVTVLRDGRPVADLPESAFHLFDQSKPAKIERFEYVRNLPLSIGVAIDTSASMRAQLSKAQDAGADFLGRVLKGGDQAFLIGFDRNVQVLRTWSRDTANLAAGLSSLRAEQTTALYDALIAALYQFQGVRGQRALILLSDGRDTASRFNWDQALGYAKRAGVPIYVIGIGISAVEIDVRPRLTQLAMETGGNVWFIDDATDLGQIYAQIESELRSQYVLAFYPPADAKPGGDWRDLRVAVDGAKAKTIRGYYP